MNILITGATGFVGKELVQKLAQQECNISIAVRYKTYLFPDYIKQFVVGDFGLMPDFSASLVDVDCVIHLAGMAHLIDKSKTSVSDVFSKINCELTLHLAEQAIENGVDRFIFLSSVGVNGNQNEKPFVETDAPNPQEPYAISKYEAEQGLLNLTKRSNLDLVIIRPPLVYGHNAPGNFGRLTKWAKSKIVLPLPLGGVNNLRSLVAIDNLVGFIIVCMRHPKAANEMFLICDDKDMSTTEVFKNVAKAFNKKVFLFPIPVNFMISIAKVFGKESDAVRLFSSLTIDISKARVLLNWTPIITMAKQLKNKQK